MMYCIIWCDFFGLRGLNMSELVCDSISKLGAGVMDIKFESPNILLSCGYDTAVRLWDIRNSSR